MTSMGRKNWSDPEVAKPMLDKIPLGKFAGMRVCFYYTSPCIRPIGNFVPDTGNY